MVAFLLAAFILGLPDLLQDTALSYLISSFTGGLVVLYALIQTNSTEIAYGVLGGLAGMVVIGIVWQAWAHRGRPPSAQVVPIDEDDPPVALEAHDQPKPLEKGAFDFQLAETMALTSRGALTDSAPASSEASGTLATPPPRQQSQSGEGPTRTDAGNLIVSSLSASQTIKRPAPIGGRLPPLRPSPVDTGASPSKLTITAGLQRSGDGELPSHNLVPHRPAVGPPPLSMPPLSPGSGELSRTKRSWDQEQVY